MTKRQIRQYIHMGEQLALVETQLERLPQVFDTVKASGREWPYLEHTMMISGPDERRANRLQRKRKYLRAKRRQVEKFIDSLPDAYMRDVLWARYIDGASWVQIEQKMGTQVDGARKPATRYLDSICRT